MQNSFSKYDDSEIFNALKGKKNEAESAFAELYARYAQRVYAYCLRVMGTPEDAGDIFQETFLKFYSSVSSHKEMDNIPGYLLTIARNMCLNYKRDQRTTFNIDDYNIKVNNNDYEKQELLQLISMALELLEFDYREAFVLRQYQGLTYTEIAEITGDSIPAIKNRVWRAKERIKEILTPYLEDMSY